MGYFLGSGDPSEESMDSAKANNKTGRLKQAVYLILAACLTGGLLWYVLATTTWRDWVQLWSGVDHRLLLAYLGLFLSTILLRGLRYQLLIRASEGAATPSLGDLTTLTLVGNLFVDLLPARSGSLAYIVLANQKLQVELAACFSSFAFSFIFDMVGMLPLFLAAVLGAQLGGGPANPWLWLVFAVLALGSLAALALIDRLVGLAARLLGRLGGAGWAKYPRLENPRLRAQRELATLARDMVLVKARGVFWPVLGLSVLIRLGKYLGLYLLILGLANQWGPQVAERLSLGLVLFSLVAAEASASLPISGLAGFGAYEGVMMLVLRQAGLEPSQASLLPVTLHIITQSIDYGLGSLALWRLAVLGRRRQAREPGGADPS